MRCDRGMIVCGDHTASRCSAESQGLPSTRPDSPGRSHIVTHVSMSRRLQRMPPAAIIGTFGIVAPSRSEEHTSELQSLMRISYDVFCLKKKNKQITECT